MQPTKSPLRPIDVERQADRAEDPFDKFYLRGVADGADDVEPESPAAILRQVQLLGLRLSDVTLARQQYARGLEIGALIRERTVGKAGAL